MAGLNIAEYFGLSPTVIDTTGVGGSSYQFHAAHALRERHLLDLLVLDRAAQGEADDKLVKRDGARAIGGRLA